MYDFSRESEFVRMYEEWFPKVYNYIFYRLLSREQTEDIVSEVFLKVVSHLSRFDSAKASFGTWVFTIARNTLTDFYRKSKPALSIDDDGFPLSALTVDWDEQSRLIENEDRRELYRALGVLNEKQRSVLSLKYFAGFSNREISRMTGMKESTVSSLGVRATAKLRSLMEKSFTV